MLELDTALPPGALCHASPGAITLDGHWWHGSEASMVLDAKTQAVTRWKGVHDTPDCTPTRGNDGNGQLGEVDGLIGLQGRRGVHCGMVAEGIVENAATATLAVRYFAPEGEDARTLVTLNAEDAGNYIFISEQAGVLTAKDDHGLAEVSLPAPRSDVPRMAIVSLHGDRLALALEDARVDVQAREGMLSGVGSLFVGCRNNRPRLLKTLGSALILDVWLFPGRALLHSDAAADKAAMIALKRHHLWATT
jgi:hypothetical protein